MIVLKESLNTQVAHAAYALLGIVLFYQNDLALLWTNKQYSIVENTLLILLTLFADISRHSAADAARNGLSCPIISAKSEKIEANIRNLVIPWRSVCVCVCLSECCRVCLHFNRFSSNWCWTHSTRSLKSFHNLYFSSKYRHQSHGKNVEHLKIDSHTQSLTTLESFSRSHVSSNDWHLQNGQIIKS